MHKNIINSFFIVALFALILLVGCRTSKYTNVSDQPPYRDLIGRHYIVLKDFYLVRLSGSSGQVLRFCGQNGAPKEFDKSKVGNKTAEGEIAGVVPKNTEFKLIKIEKYDLVDNSIHVVILVPIISVSPRYSDVSASVLRNENTKMDDFKFDNDLVKEVQDSILK